MNFVLILLITLISFISFGQNMPISYIPDYTEEGYLNVNQLNSAIRLSALQYDGKESVNLVIPKGTYYLPNNKTINMSSYVNLKCEGVTFIYKWVTDEYSLNIIELNNITNAGVYNLNIDFSQAYTDKKPSYKNADKFINRSIIQLEHCDSIIIDNVTIKKIIGSGIEISNTKNSIVSNCNISGSWILGNESGTQGYSINLVGTMTKNNLIENNKLSDARHLIILQYACFNNVIRKNQTSGAGALKKVLFFEIIDRNFTYDVSLHGNSPHHNIIDGNNIASNLYIDNIKTNGNGPGNELINNIVKGRLVIESKAPYYDYNCCQIVKGNKYGSMRIEAKDCIIENNTKL